MVFNYSKKDERKKRFVGLRVDSYTLDQLYDLARKSKRNISDVMRSLIDQSFRNSKGDKDGN